MPGLLGKKIGMTSIFTEAGKNIPCTVLEVGPCVVTQVKTEEIDGYKALQVGYDDVSQKHSNKACMGHARKANVPIKKIYKEFSGYKKDWKLGDTITLEIFNDDVYVDVIGLSKGKGFQGVVRRHGFSGVNDQTHGQHNRGRAPGSLGASSHPSRVFKGMRMAGRMGGDNVKVLNLQVMKLIPEKNLMVVKGAVPGANGTYITVVK